MAARRLARLKVHQRPAAAPLRRATRPLPPSPARGWQRPAAARPGPCRLFESLDRRRKVVVMLSPAHLQSKVCRDEFNIAWAVSRNTGADMLFPICLRRAPLPPCMKMPSFVDCRHGDPGRHAEACTALLASLR